MKKSLLSLLLCLFTLLFRLLQRRSKTACIYNPWNSQLSLPDCSTARFSVRRSRLFRQWQHAFRCTGIRRNSSWKVPLLGTFGTARPARTKILQQLPDLLQQYRLSSGWQLLNHSLAGRSQHGNPAGKPETGRTKRTYA